MCLSSSQRSVSKSKVHSCHALAVKLSHEQSSVLFPDPPAGSRHAEWPWELCTEDGRDTSLDDTPTDLHPHQAFTWVRNKFLCLFNDILGFVRSVLTSTSSPSALSADEQVLCFTEKVETINRNMVSMYSALLLVLPNKPSVLLFKVTPTCCATFHASHSLKDFAPMLFTLPLLSLPWQLGHLLDLSL